MVSPAIGAAMMGTMYLLRADCVQHGGGSSVGGLISAALLTVSYRALTITSHLYRLIGEISILR